MTLTRITSLAFQDPQILLRKTLALGCDYLKMSTGAISLIYGDELEIKAAQSPGNLIKEGQRIKRNQTYSDLLNMDMSIVYIHHLGQSEYRDHPSYLHFQQESYIGIPLLLEGERYGTLAFSDASPRSDLFTDVEIEFVNLLGDWVNSTLKKMTLNHSLQLQQQMNDIVARSQSQFIKGQNKRDGFKSLLTDTLQLNQGEFGFICEVMHDHNNQPYLKIHAVFNGSEQQEYSGKPERKPVKELTFDAIDTISRLALTTGQPMSYPLAQTTDSQLQVPDWYPAIRHLLSIPIHHDGVVIALITLANYQNITEVSPTEFLQPILITIAQLVNAAKIQRQHEESEKRLANIIEGTNIGTWECHVPSGKTVLNERWAEMLGYTLEELSPTTVQTWLDLCHPDDMKISANLIEQHFKGQIPYYDMISRLRHKDGHWVWIRDRGCVVSWSADGQPLVMSGSHQDVTQERLAEEKLAHAYELLEQSNAAARIGTWEYDLDTQQIYWSNVTRQIHEVDQDYICELQNAITFYKPGKNRERISALLIRAAQDGERYDDEFEIITARKNEKWVRVIGLPQWKDGRIQRVYGTFQDISESKATAIALKEQAAQTQAILDNVLDGIITVDYRGRIAAYNSAAANIFGYRRNQLIGQHFSVLLPPDNVQGELNPFGSLMNIDDMVGISREIEARRQNGDVFPLDLSISAVRRQGRPLYIGLVRDITERKRLEKIKNEFIATVSHELRTPLTSISGALGLILGGAAGGMSDSMSSLLTIASKNSQRLSFLINDLLDMEKLSAGKMQFHIQPFELTALLQQAVETNLTFSTQRKIHLQLQNPLPEVFIAVDSQRLMQILSNLLSNAIKYSPENETVQIAAKTVGAHVRINISDHGTGIPEEFYPRIFQKFAQADSSDTRQKGGTGLGLAISRELVEQMGGKISFESITGQGSHFYIDFPILKTLVKTA
nr:PAS domain S-box protein [Undibacterium oligocarboniphilum]